MSIDLKQIEHLAKLARLELTLAEKKKYQTEISGILEYVAQIQAVKTVGDLAVEQSLSAGNFRADEALIADGAEQERIIQAFPETKGRLTKVKAVFEQ